jgi:DNA-binding transcriptional MocR family regulator
METSTSVPSAPSPSAPSINPATRSIAARFSKTIAPGYRIGWLATSRHMQRVLEHNWRPRCSPGLPQAALADFLSCGGYDSHLRMVIPLSAGATRRFDLSPKYVLV